MMTRGETDGENMVFHAIDGVETLDTSEWCVAHAAARR